jgi:hypothetical protein
MQPGRIIALYGDTGSGKTTQAGEYAKFVRKTKGKNTRLNTADMGGFRTLLPHVNLGFVIPNQFKPETDDAWIWLDEAVSGKNLDPSIGCEVFDSGTSISEALLSACSHADFQIGQQRTQKFVVSRGQQTLNVAINNEAHYGVVQGFMLDKIWQSTWLARKGIDVIWTFSVHRGEEQDRTPILGPKLAGKALTAAIPKWFEYTFRLASVPQDGLPPRHLLYLTEHSELSGLGHSFGNARYPLDAQTALPASIEPASIIEAIRLIEEVGQQEAEDSLRLELGL